MVLQARFDSAFANISDEGSMRLLGLGLVCTTWAMVEYWLDHLLLILGPLEPGPVADSVSAHVGFRDKIEVVSHRRENEFDQLFVRQADGPLKGNGGSEADIRTRLLHLASP